MPLLTPLSSSPIFYLTLLIFAWSPPFLFLPLLPFLSPSFSTLSSPSSHPFCPACVAPLLSHPPCLLLSIFPDPCLCFFPSASLSLPPGPLRPGSDDAGVLVPQPLCPPHCTADQEDTSETQQQSGEAQSNSLATGLKPDSPGPAVCGGGRWMVVYLGGGSVSVVLEWGGTPLGEGCACSVQPLSPSSQKYCWVETRSPTVWPAQNSRLPDAWLPPYPHALGASLTIPGQDAKEAPEPGWPCQGIPVSWAQSLGLHSTPCPWSTSRRATTRAAKVAGALSGLR